MKGIYSNFCLDWDVSVILELRPLLWRKAVLIHCVAVRLLYYADSALASCGDVLISHAAASLVEVSRLRRRLLRQA